MLTELPQNCHCYTTTAEDGVTTPVQTKDGFFVFYYVPALLDLDAVSKEIHVLAIALYIGRTFPTLCGAMGKQVLFLVDARRGTGWKNPNVLKVNGFLQLLSDVLHKLAPGRIGKMMIYPVPTAYFYVFKMLKRVLPTSISQSVVLISGVDEVDAPLPYEKLLKHGVSKEIVDMCEVQRRSQYMVDKA